MTISRGPAIIDKLRDAIPAVLEPVQFSEGWPGGKIQRTTFMVLDYDSNIEVSGTNPPTAYTEDGRLENYLLISLPGKKAPEVREKAFEIANTFAAWVRSDFTLGGVVCGWAWISAVQWVPGTGDNARDGHLRIELSWHDNNI